MCVLMVIKEWQIVLPKIRNTSGKGKLKFKTRSRSEKGKSKSKKSKARSRREKDKWEDEIKRSTQEVEVSLTK